MNERLFKNRQPQGAHGLPHTGDLPLPPIRNRLKNKIGEIKTKDPGRCGRGFRPLIFSARLPAQRCRRCGGPPDLPRECYLSPPRPCIGSLCTVCIAQMPLSSLTGKNMMARKRPKNRYNLGRSNVFRGSTMVVQLPVKELVVGSNPTRGASSRTGLVFEKLARAERSSV